MSWTDERVELLKNLWNAGQSASQIAKELGGVTRNAVIGKVYRLGLSNRTESGDVSPKPEVPAKQKTNQTQAKKEKTKPGSQTTPDAVPSAPVKTLARTKIVPADKRLPPQPSANEVSPEALASQREIEKKALRLTLMELTERTCKWPFGDPASDDFWFCGLPVEPGKCYCEPCAKVAYQAASVRRDRRR